MKDGSIAGIAIGLFRASCWDGIGLLGVVSGPDPIAAGVYGGGSTSAELGSDGPATLSKDLSKFSNGFCDFSLAMAMVIDSVVLSWIENRQAYLAGGKLL